MIVELRTYSFHPGKASAFLQAYENGPIDLQRSILGNMLGYFSAETGNVNQLVHLWGYASFEDRARRRAALAAHSDWKPFLKTILPMLVSQESKLLKPLPFSPVYDQLIVA